MMVLKFPILSQQEIVDHITNLLFLRESVNPRGRRYSAIQSFNWTVKLIRRRVVETTGQVCKTGSRSLRKTQSFGLV